MDRMNRLFRYLLFILRLVLAVNSLAGGFLFMLKPDGSLLQMDASWLSNSPFNTYFIPGLLLFVFIGILSMVTFLGLIVKFRSRLLNYLNIYPDKHWA